MAPTDFHLLTRHYQGLAQPVRVVVEPAVGGDAAVEHLVQPAGEGEDLAQGAADRGLAQAVAEAAQAEDGVGLAQAEPGEALRTPPLDGLGRCSASCWQPRPTLSSRCWPRPEIF